MLRKKQIIQGTPISGGIVLGHARVILPGNIEVPEIAVPAYRLRDEAAALDRAIEETIVELKALRESAGKKVGGPVARIFDAQLMIAGDYEFLKTVKSEIEARRRNAGFVYNSLVINTTTPLKSSDDPYMRQMAKDIEAVARKVLSHLSGYSKRDHKFAPNTILVGKFFSPGEVLSYRQRKAIGFLVSEGGTNSHMALIARGLLLPMVVVRHGWNMVPDHSRIILDGSTGTVIVNPTDDDWQEYQRRRKRLGPALIKRIRKLSQIPPVTRDGKEIGVGANLALPGPADDILSEQKIPVGLYRTEFLYLAHGAFPDEETQYRYYQQIADKFAGTSVIIRTFDLGYDKLSTESVWMSEDNPALGWRGIRPMLDMSPVFKTQIRAILRASTRKNIKIMLPMITELGELEKARKLIAQVKFRLRKDGLSFDPDIKLGIMVEVPSAAMTADALARKVDFMSIGTNDLTQYTLAVDRMNSRVAHLYSAFHPAVLNLIKMTVEACKKHDIPVSICGEVAGDILALPLFVGMELDMLSMNPSRIFDFCRAVRKIDSRLVRHIVGSVMASGSPSEALQKLENFRTAMAQQKR
ncbi:MAG: phosphoenolpyruvate--protein phosphotransferase [candidate division Zixibacteria bacterium]|nr:phosphoenolpyruvate--protein phosphotransferase [candidate division Zixibacteria bacterium]